MTKEQEKFEKALRKAWNIMAQEKAKKFFTITKAYEKIAKKTQMKFVGVRPTIPPWHTFVWIEPKANKDEMERREDERGNVTFIKNCIDCGAEYETVNENRTSCDTCHDIRLANKGYKTFKADGDETQVEFGKNKKTYYRH